MFFKDMFSKLRRMRIHRIRHAAVYLAIFLLSATAMASAFILADMYLGALPNTHETTTTSAKQTTPPPPETTTPAPETTTPEATETTRKPLPVFEPGERAECILGETEDAGQEYIDSLIFLGDSRTYGLKAYKMLSGGIDTEQVWVPDSGTLQVCDAYNTYIRLADGTDMKLKELLELKKPPFLVISLGINYVNYAKASRPDEDDFKYWYKKLLDTVIKASPDTTIIVQSIFPVNEEVYKTYDNATLIERNDWLLDLAYEYGLYYLNTAEALADEYGNLYMKYQNGDGCHPGHAGYTAILNYIRTHALPGYAEETTSEVTTTETSTPIETTSPEATSEIPEITSDLPEVTSDPAVTITPEIDPPLAPETSSAEETTPDFETSQDSTDTTNDVTETTSDLTTDENTPL